MSYRAIWRKVPLADNKIMVLVVATTMVVWSSSTHPMPAASAPPVANTIQRRNYSATRAPHRLRQQQLLQITIPVVAAAFLQQPPPPVAIIPSLDSNRATIISLDVHYLFWKPLRWPTKSRRAVVVVVEARLSSARRIAVKMFDRINTKWVTKYLFRLFFDCIFIEIIDKHQCPLKGHTEQFKYYE